MISQPGVFLDTINELSDARVKNRWKIGSSYEGVSRSFRTGRLERENQVVQLSATGCSCITILWFSLVSFAAITRCVASQRVFVVVVAAAAVISLSTQSGNFWIHPRTCLNGKRRNLYENNITASDWMDWGKQRKLRSRWVIFFLSRLEPEYEKVKLLNYDFQYVGVIWQWYEDISKFSGLAAWSQNCKWYGSLPLGAGVSPFCESV
jgi:hypothetical protein